MVDSVKPSRRVLLWIAVFVAIASFAYVGIIAGRNYSHAEALDAHQARQFATARSYCIVAAELGSPDAAALLGTMYLRGEGGPVDGKSALYWLEIAAGDGVVIAESILGIMFATGQGVAVNDDQAKFWLTRASVHGDSTARNMLMKFASPNSKPM